MQEVSAGVSSGRESRVPEVSRTTFFVKALTSEPSIMCFSMPCVLTSCSFVGLVWFPLVAAVFMLRDLDAVLDLCWGCFELQLLAALNLQQSAVSVLAEGAWQIPRKKASILDRQTNSSAVGTTSHTSQTKTVQSGRILGQEALRSNHHKMQKMAALARFCCKQVGMRGPPTPGIPSSIELVFRSPSCPRVSPP